MPTYTVFAFGTNENIDMPGKNIISSFHDACNSEKCVINGPKTTGRGIPKNIEKGRQDIIDWLKKQTQPDNSLNLTGFSRGAVICIRIANRLKSLENELCQKQALLSKEDTKLLEKLQRLKIHIYAHDPVAGPGDKGKINARTIPSNVKQYVAVLQMDEMRRDFKPQDLSRVIIESPKDTQVSMLPMYGGHSSCTQMKIEEERSGSRFSVQNLKTFSTPPNLVAKEKSGAELNWYGLFNFLTQHGTSFKINAIPDLTVRKKKSQKEQRPASPLPQVNKEELAVELLKLFSQHQSERTVYKKSAKAVNLFNGLPITRIKRTLNKHLDLYVKQPDFFINSLERGLFKVKYPQVFNYLFEQSLIDPRFPHKKQQIKQELQNLRDNNPDLFRRLEPLEVRYNISDNEITFPDKPQGLYCLESCDSVRQLYPSLPELEGVAPSEDISNLNRLENEIYRLTLRYEREKSAFSPFNKRHQAQRTESIRKEVKSIVENPLTKCPETDEPEASKRKYERLLQVLEKHYLELIQIQSASALKPMLKNILEKHQRQFIIKQGSLPRKLAAKCINQILSLIKELLNFIGSLGYVGSGILSTPGLFFQDIGQRLVDIVGDCGKNPIKLALSGLGLLFKGIGLLLKENLGLKPLNHFVVNGVRQLRNIMVSAIGGIEVKRIEDDLSPSKANETNSSTRFDAKSYAT